MASTFIVVYETWLDDKEHYTYTNVSAFKKKADAEKEAENLNEMLPDDLSSFDSYYVDEVGLF